MGRSADYRYEEHPIPPTGPRVLMITEGSYPYHTGGVTTWCKLLIRGLSDLRWQILPITAGRHRRRHADDLVPAGAFLLPPIELWSDRLDGRRTGRATRPGLAAELASGLLSWNGSSENAIEVLAWCRENPTHVRRCFQGADAWDAFVSVLSGVLEERPIGVSSVPRLSNAHVTTLFQALYWVAYTASVATPPTDVLLVTAAGWSSIPAVVHRRLSGTPMLLVEHGVYVREAYLAASKAEPGNRFVETRLARGLARLAYSAADLVNPVNGANAVWEEALGVEPSRICTIPNGMASNAVATPLPGDRLVVSMGRLDPLKDIHTLLRTAAAVVRHDPEAQFLHYGPYRWPPSGGYGRTCRELHENLKLGDRFQFMGFADDAAKAIRSADIILMTSISEGFPMSLLEAMAEARPVVSTWVGGIPEVIRGCGVLSPPGDVESLATGVLTLLRDPALAHKLGALGHARLVRKFSDGNWLPQYRDVLRGMANDVAA